MKPFPTIIAECLRILEEAKKEPSEALVETSSRIHPKDCYRCPRSRSRTRPVVSSGKAEILLLVEAPGVEEDLAGRPVVSPQKEMLMKMIETVLEVPLDQVLVLPALPCGSPTRVVASEVSSCTPILKGLIQDVGAKHILALGSDARLVTSRVLEEGTYDQTSGLKEMIRDPSLKRAVFVALKAFKKRWDP